MIKAYFDNCVYNRPFDDQTLERVFIEARAFYIILKWIEGGRITAIDSDAIEYENALTSNIDRRQRVKSYLSLAQVYVTLTDSLIERAHEIRSFGFRAMDALHVAMAEEANADYFVTCDDAIVKMGGKIQNRLRVKVRSILEFFEEVITGA